ncbi:aldehyde dehydrogenase family protein [Spirillospora sp. NPDC048819]|uniref:aldehyde dehydrogenase family protein n=1 Tax=Spirillospora sp. NPDC048819 TaxID=3155268 RepID=UPI0034066E16
MLESYANGQWFRASDDGHPLLDAATGEEVARLSSTGLDLAAMAGHAREVGGPAVRRLTFHERAAVLKAVAKHLSGVKDELYSLSAHTGATPRDSEVDIDGGIGTLFSYAGRGTRELPNETIVLDGDTERLGRSGVFSAQHVYTSRTGVAVQINAFNFPVWGMLEKLATAFLAGLPSIVKPASQGTYLTERAVRHIIGSGLMPEGRCNCCAAVPTACSTSWGHRTRSRSPARPPPPPRCVSTRRSSTTACGSVSRPIRSTARSSDPTSARTTRNSTSSSRAL